MARLSEIAAYLQQKRLELSLPLEYIQQRTQIRVSLLQAIEEGKFDNLPEPVYIKGFIRLYGNAIGVDGDALAHNFIQASQGSNVQTAPTQTALAEPIPVNTFTPSFTLPDKLSERLRLRYSIPYLVLLVLATSILSWLVRQPTENKQVQTQTQSESDVSDVEAKPSSVTDSDRAKIAQESPPAENSTPSPEAQISTEERANSQTTANLSTTPRQEKEKSSQAVEEVESSPQTNPNLSIPVTSSEEKPRDTPVNSTPTPSPTTTSSQPLSVKMQLEGGDSWLRVTVDGEAVYEGILQDGEERTWDAQGEIKIRSGNAGFVKLSTNQGQSQAMGNPGEVKEVTINSETSPGTVGN